MLPKFNGICDGIILICFFELLTCIIGNEFWIFSFYGYYFKISKILIYFCFIYGFYLCFISFTNVSKKIQIKFLKLLLIFLYIIFKFINFISY